MKIIADLHLHSKYSRAVSQQMILPEMAKWAKRKGIDLLGTGDFTHPLWFRELKAGLEEVAPGLFSLKSARGPVGLHPHPTSSSGSAGDAGARWGSPAPATPRLSVSDSRHPSPLFLLSTEISSIYSQGGKLRRIHNLVLAPSLEAVEKINQALLRRGANLMSDGRPIIGLSARDLVELVLGVDEKSLVVPAHAWTPWFSLYGSESGFDSIDECFGDMAKNIFAVETGLSSNPEMNWRIAELDSRQIISFSDAHSGAKLGREATVFEISDEPGVMSYESIRKAITHNSEPKTHNLPRVAYTIEFYPEEGKYHYTGHRNCNVRQSPEETRRLGEVCPVCGRHLTVGVIHRVEKLASRNVKCQITNDKSDIRWIENENQHNRPPYVMLVPLLEIIAESLESLPASQRVINEYNNLTDRLGPEFKVLLAAPIEEIAKVAGGKVAQGVEKVRKGNIKVEPGYDGVFGTVKIWSSDSAQNGTAEEKKDQLSLF